MDCDQANQNTDVVHIDVRLRLHRQAWLDTMPVPTFVPTHESIHLIIDHIKNLLTTNDFIKNSDIQPSSQIKTIVIPAVPDAVTSPTISPSPSDADRDNHSDSSSHTDTEEDCPLPSDICNDTRDVGGAYFSVDLIRVKVDDTHNNDDQTNCKQIPQTFAVFCPHFYHPRPSHWLPPLPPTLREFASVHVLPHDADEGAWDSLQDSDGNKATVLRHVMLRHAFGQDSGHGSDVGRTNAADIMSMNGTVLLCGGPGTGKTSMCRALAHQAAIRLNTYGRGIFVHVRMHRMSSRYFGQSGSNIAKMFRGVRELVKRGVPFVTVMLDEVESVAMSRSFSMAGDGSGGDSIRAVNTLLTELDGIRTVPNVIVLSTTNLARAVDEAYLDRMDVVLEIHVPDVSAICQLIRRFAAELGRKGVVVENSGETVDGETLQEIGNVVNGVSARRLCKLMVVACSMAGGVDAFPLSLDSIIDKMLIASRQWCKSQSKYDR